MQKSQHTPQYRRLIGLLRQARERSGLLQDEVSKKLGTYASYVSKCESGERRIDVVELARFCKIYGLNLPELLRESGLCK